MKLTTENVETVIKDCLNNKGEDIQKCLLVEGIVQAFGFNQERLLQHREEIREMLNQLPLPFFTTKQEPNGGDGYSFLCACEDRNGVQWGDHKWIDALFALGTAVGMVSVPLPRMMWGALPGGMPYYVVDTRPGFEQPPPTRTPELQAALDKAIAAERG